MATFFLAVSHEHWPTPSIRTFSQLTDSLQAWTATTRVSPLYTYPNLFAVQGSVPTPAQSVLLLGFAHPEDVRQQILDRAAIYLSLGAFNVVIFDPSEDDSQLLIDWALSTGHPYEHWKIRDGLIESASFAPAPISDGEIEHGVARVASLALDAELHDAVSEYCPLMASAYLRATRSFPEVLTDLMQVHASVSERLRRAEGGISEEARYELLGSLITLNAGLSRFSSQAFSGTPPVAATESHYWTHSLLGTGLANRALWRLSQFVLQQLGEARLIHRVESLRSEAPRQLRSLRPSDPFWTDFDIMKTDLSVEALAEPLIPLISCFSGRDGFKCTQETISAPVASIAACNSVQWSLLTLTHEASHLFVRGILGLLIPPLDKRPPQVPSVLKTPSNLLEDVQAYVEAALFGMEEVERGPVRNINAHTSAEVRAKWFDDLEEMLVHAFDYLYFYGFDDERYVRGIWQSWSVIPNIESRVPQYVLRTAVALLTQYTSSHEHADSIAVARTEELLRKLAHSNSGGQYVRRALDYIDSAREQLLHRVSARRPLAQLVRSVLFSQALASSLRKETLATGGDARRLGYPYTIGELTRDPIGNPLTFLEAYSNSTEPDAVSSLWILTMLALSTPSSGRQEKQ